MNVCTHAEYFIGIYCELIALRAIAKSELIKLPPTKKKRLIVLEFEVRELARRLGFSDRRKVNAVVVPLGYPAVKRGDLGPPTTSWETP